MNIEEKILARRSDMRDERKWLKEHHFCRECHCKDAYTLSGRTKCAECAAKEAKLKREKRANDPVYRHNQLEYHKKWVQKKIDEGLCSYCGKRKTDSNHKTCVYCRQKFARQRRERNAEKSTINYPRGENGFCWQCNKKMAIQGYRLCQDCYNKKILIAMKNLELTRSQHPWHGKFIYETNYKQKTC